MFYDVQCCNRCGLSVPHIFHWSELTQGPVSGEGGNRVPAGVRENEEEADCWRERERERAPDSRTEASDQGDQGGR